VAWCALRRSIVVRKPSGEVVGRGCREDCLFQAYELVSEHKVMQFRKDGFLVSVSAADVTEVRYHCPQCGMDQGSEGLCERCRASWLPNH
jgi:hypothetical protein